MSWNTIWEDIFRSRPWGKYPSEEIIRFIAKNYYDQDRAEIKILELGCGTGSNLWYLSREGFSIYGIDGSETAIVNARKRLNSEVGSWSGELVVGDFSNRLPFDDNSFDAIVDVEAISCNSFESSKDIYNESYRVLKSGGKMFSKMFADRCTGSGVNQDKGSDFIEVRSGPLEGFGRIRFTSYASIQELFDKFHIQSVELVSKSSLIPNHQTIEEWVVVAQKV